MNSNCALPCPPVFLRRSPANWWRRYEALWRRLAKRAATSPIPNIRILRKNSFAACAANKNQQRLCGERQAPIHLGAQPANAQAIRIPCLGGRRSEERRVGKECRARRGQ